MKKISDEQLLTILKDVENLHWDGVKFIWRVRPYRVKGKKRLMKGVYISQELIRFAHTHSFTSCFN